MKRIYQSGSEKRKKRQAKQIQEETGKRTLDGFLYKQSTRVNEVDEQAAPEIFNTKEDGAEVVSTSVEVGVAETEEAENSVASTTTSRIEEIGFPPSPNPPNVLDYPSLDRDEEGSLYCSDPATWKNLDAKKRDFIALKGPLRKPETFPRDSTGRNFPISVLYKKLNNGESVDRDWMVWSNQNQALWCFPCCLFKNESDSDPDTSHHHSKFVEGGINDNWKKIYDKVKSHEANTLHLNNYIKWKELVHALSGKGAAIDEALLRNIKLEEERWRKILTAVVDVILFLAQRNLPFRGNHSTIDYDDCGLFLSTLRLVGRYNTELKQHLDTVAEFREVGRKMQAHYLSWRSQNEFLKLCGEKVLSAILNEVRIARYYSIIVDGTLDVSHTEQLVFILRYVLEKNGTWNIYEKFIKLVDCDQKTGAAIAEQIKLFLKDCNLELSSCRGQGYDNASNMSGKFQGVKTRILEENPQAYFSPCGAHSLNLCGIHAMETSVDVKSFFGNIQKLYKVFALSPARWKILQNTTGVSLHPISSTRWSARIDAVRPLVKNYEGVLEALTEVEEMQSGLSPEIAADVDGLLTWLRSFEFILLITIWFKILQCIDDKNKVLQSSKLTLEEGANILHSLVEEIQMIRDAWLQLLEEAKHVASSIGVEPELNRSSRVRKKKRFFDDSAEADYDFLSPDDRFRVQVFLPTMDLLLSELTCLSKRMSEVAKLFSPIMCPPNDVSEASLEHYAEALATAYPTDLQKDDLADELRIFYKISKQSNLYVDGHIASALKLLNTIFQKGLESVLPQICVCLRLLMVLPVTVASGERAFSKLSLIKNRLRSTTSEDRLNYLLSLSIEHEMAKNLSFDDIIDYFAKMKSRAKKF